jgi:hypothetical protein
MKIKTKPINQYCIKGHFLEEILGCIPEKVKIDEVAFEVGFAIKRMTISASSSLKAKGVTSVRSTEPSVEVEGKLYGSRKQILSNAKDICSAYSLNPKTVRIKRMLVSCNGNTGVLHRMTKMIPDKERVRRVAVLGLVKWEGDEKALASSLTASTFICRYDTQIVRIVLCEEK